MALNNYSRLRNGAEQLFSAIPDGFRQLEYNQGALKPTIRAPITSQDLSFDTKYSQSQSRKTLSLTPHPTPALETMRSH